MIRFLSDTNVKFRAYPKHPDYFADAEGATLYPGALWSPFPSMAPAWAKIFVD